MAWVWGILQKMEKREGDGAGARAEFNLGVGQAELLGRAEGADEG